MGVHRNGSYNTSVPDKNTPALIAHSKGTPNGSTSEEILTRKNHLMSRVINLNRRNRTAIITGVVIGLGVILLVQFWIRIIIQDEILLVFLIGAL